MPYESRSQEQYFNANRAKMEAQGVDVDEWNKASKGKNLPAHKGKTMEKHHELRKMEIEPAENGGHTVTHHKKPKMSKDRHSHAGMSMGYEEPEHHVFGKDEGHEMLAHIANHLGISEGMGKEEKDEVDNDDGVGKED
jgi:hypothetical protein